MSGTPAGSGAPMRASTAREAGIALFRHGFRPFFLLVGLWAVGAMLLWLAALHGAKLADGLLPGARWHAHEMIAGFIGAAMAGFLLTAIPNWTGRPGYAGAPVMALAALFVLARAVLLPGVALPPGLAATLALLPLPGMILLVLPALAAARSARLFGPPVLILAFWTGDLLMLGEAAGWFAQGWATGQRLALNVALVLVGLIGGRIVPTFTQNALRRAGDPAALRPLPGVDAAAIAALAAVALVDVLAPDGPVAGVAAAVAAGLVALRLSRWQGLRTVGEPLLWVLHLAYALVPAALALKAAALLGGAAWAANWLHLQAAGAIALMILAVTTRATLGHTGRPLRAAPPVAAAYLLLLGAALLRVFGDGPLGPTLSVALAALLWVTAFALYLVVFAPMLLAPRPDGRPG
jgi:uncharacterized protein involved in response to NO